MTTEFICTRPDCGHTWSMEADEDGLFDGYGLPPCPVDGGDGAEASDYGDFECPEGHTFRKYGNGGLVLGMVPLCPIHKVLPLDG